LNLTVIEIVNKQMLWKQLKHHDDIIIIIIIIIIV